MEEELESAEITLDYEAAFLRSDCANALALLSRVHTITKAAAVTATTPSMHPRMIHRVLHPEFEISNKTSIWPG
jgi:hypothetical protein